MAASTEKRILDAALKVFGEKGYKGVTTKDIASKSGFDESTLFRNFGTKKNLFKSVLNENNQKMNENLNKILSNNEFKTQKEFLETLIHNLAALGKNNLEFIKITMNENDMVQGRFLEEFINGLSRYIEKNLPDKKIDYDVFVFGILSFIYLLILDYGHAFSDHDHAIEKFVDNISKSI